METMHYIGLDVHKKIISYCIKSYKGKVLERGNISSTRPDLVNNTMHQYGKGLKTS